MSVIKSQIHDGFATIRTRGVHRSRSRAEQLEKLKPIITKSDSVPLYENNNDLYYNFRKSTDRSDINDLTKTINSTEFSDIGSHFSTLSASCNSFKRDNTDRSGRNLDDHMRSFECLAKTPPPINSYYDKDIHTAQTPVCAKGTEYYLYTRPESPAYGHIKLRDSKEDCSDISIPNRLFTPTYYRKDAENFDYAFKKVAAKPPIKSHSLHYRKSYSHSNKTIYEDNCTNSDENGANYYSAITNYYKPSDISESRFRNARNGDVFSDTNLSPTKYNNAFDKRYATLSYPKETQHFRPQQRYSTSQVDDTQLQYIDPLDCKIGCQTTLRSKPRIPWYELAIRKENRRQSCPPNNEAHVVAAFEQSLTNMTQRLQQLSATADRKDGELTEMRQTIELLRKQSIQAGLTSAHMHSMNEQSNRLVEPSPAASIAEASVSASTPIQRHHSSDSMCSLNSLSSGCSAQDKKKSKKGWLRSSFTKAFSRNAKISKTSRHVSTSSNLDHVAALNSSAEIAHAGLPPPSPSRSPHKMGTVAEHAKPPDLDIEGNPIVEDLKKQLREKDLVLTDIRLEALSSASQLESLKDTVSKMRQEMMNLKQNNERLQKMVTSRSLAGSECSLGGPISPSGSMGEPRRYSLADGNLRPPLELPKSLDETEEENIPPAPAPEPPPIATSPTSHSGLTPPPPIVDSTGNDHLSTPADDAADHTDGKKISIVVYLGQPESFQKYAEDVHESDHCYSTSKLNEVQENGFDNKTKSFLGVNRIEFVIAFTYISGKTTWQNLDYIVRKTFKDYLARIDPGTNLGLNTDSITSYHLGDAKRGPEMGFPELLPCGYIIGNVKSLYICLQGVGSLAFESLIPRSIVHRYISLLTEHRRLILCGPSGTGKSYLARKLAEFLVARSQRGNPSEAIATFNVDHKSSKELRQYLGHIAEQASMTNGASELPSVIILDNLHHASALGDVFQVLLSAGPAAKLPCIIGTMSQATCNTTNLQLHHNFRWVLTANHMEPVKGFLGRYLRRRLYSMELSTNSSQPQLAAVFAWLPTVWQHINRFLETHSSSDVTIGPRLFLSCPLDVQDSQVWFTDVWNYHLEPYLVEAVREGVQLYGRRGGVWVDPSTFIRETYPWPMINGPASIPPLRLINAEDVGLEGGVTGNLDSQDPLLNMLMRLQEAANYSGNQEQESDCASLDSNITQDSSAGAE